MIKKERTNRIDFTQGRNEVMVRLFSHVKSNKILLMFLLSAFFLSTTPLYLMSFIIGVHKEEQSRRSELFRILNYE